ncbi:DUF6000 family protein [Streptomyces cyaneofuscatus]|uniref:DUF6000 family protein n=1 Tax=Streptomyces cyaneofuscatus TaxID=66883 RepID=UPI0033B7193C
MGALAYTESALHGDRANHLLQEGGLWRQWFQDAPHMHGDDDISSYLSGIRVACAVVDECAAIRLPSHRDARTPDVRPIRLRDHGIRQNRHS